jgi:hypothetical protein
MKTYQDGIRDAIDLLKVLKGNSTEYIIDRLQDYEYAYMQEQSRGTIPTHTITKVERPDESTGFSLFGDLE